MSATMIDRRTARRLREKLLYKYASLGLEFIQETRSDATDLSLLALVVVAQDEPLGRYFVVDDDVNLSSDRDTRVGFFHMDDVTRFVLRTLPDPSEGLEEPPEGSLRVLVIAHSGSLLCDLEVPALPSAAAPSSELN